jgi:uncharacterized protein YukE
MTLRHGIALHRTRSEIDNGARFDDALQLLLRQVGGFSRKLEIADQIRNVQLSNIEQLIRALADATKALRQNNYLSNERLTRLFLNLTMLMRRK